MFAPVKKLKSYLLCLLVILIVLSAADLLASRYALSVTHITSSTEKILSLIHI